MHILIITYYAKYDGYSSAVRSILPFSPKTFESNQKPNENLLLITEPKIGMIFDLGTKLASSFNATNQD